MTNYKLVPVEPTEDMLRRAMGVPTCFSGEYGQYNDFLDEGTARELYEAFTYGAPAVQVEPVAAQRRFRHPQKSSQDWSIWQPASISLDRPSWEIDSQGWEVEYRLLYAPCNRAAQPPTR